ncbi:tetratricopeptide repeat protein [Polynucleobacter sp. AP-Ainpum-60-G11]|uniref:tetratricopeptide repeat protein n=1 Tax=Polynucleobacter sp. AP-Ainpum-60-G11 TaxID=2576926 RepID=UPI001BFD276D|nr:tetratricopeptide repeat protein [Polynucleobacter sp. AP-Ainpum-60-G11]QWE27141.1 tetratricopeptide repeat protein [Polynucleobacter sp. AP-Ainpum-60-G11]
MSRRPTIPSRKLHSLNRAMPHQEKSADLINESLALIHSCHYDEARIRLESILKTQPNYFDALHILGVLFLMTHQFTKAFDVLSKALKINPNFADAHSNLGNALKELGRLDEALLSYDKAISINPNFVGAYSNRGVTLQILTRLDEALLSYEKAISINPNFADAHSNLGNALKELGRLDEALLSYDKAISINPNFADAHSNLGNALKELGRLDEALLSYDKAISINPNNAKAHSNLGNALKELGRLDEALLSYDKAISINPNFADAHSNRGDALRAQGRLEEALLNTNKAISINPNSAGAHCNRGVTLLALGRLNEALTDFDKAISIKANFTDAYSNRGVTLQALGRLNEALADYNKAINISPNYADANWNLSLAHLLMGNFKAGWQGYEWGWKNKARGTARTFSQPLWLGKEPLIGKKILVYAEQGLGDIIQFCRYLELLNKLGAYVILEAPKKIAPLIQGAQGFDEFILSGDPLPSFDYQCPLMSLPLAFHTEVDTIPQPIKYLDIPLDAINHVKQEIELKQAKEKLKIGISWRSLAKSSGASRSIELVDLIRGITLDNIQFINLQYGDTSNEIIDIRDSLGINIIESSINIYDDMLGLGALIEACDLVISIDNTTVHLAGALGKPTLVLLPFIADWRWLSGRTDSPWYPSLKLYRQNKMGDWGAVLKEIQKDLRFVLGEST